MKRILLYAPDLVGHPRVYCRVIADAMESEPCQLVLALGFTDAVGLPESPDLQPLASRPGVTLIDSRTFSKLGKPHLMADELLRLQTHFAVDTTLFIEGDKSNKEFRRIARGESPRLRGRNLGIFAKTAEWYPGEDSFTGAPRRLLAPTIRTTLGNIRRAVFNRRDSACFFYEQTLIKAGVLDEILVKDERLAQWHGAPVYWMPEISRPTSAPETAAEREDFLIRQAEMKAFLSANSGRETVLYFGDAAYYKGYDLFLEFVASNPSTCALHPGRSYDAQQLAYFRSDVHMLRTQLIREGRLYETNAYIHTQCLKALFFGAIRLYITTHRLALSSSTVIQATEFGKPVLVPDRGLLGHRVRNNHLGGVYRYEDLEDLSQKAEQLWNSDLSRYDAPVKSFWNRFSDKSVREFFSKRLLG